MNRITLAFQATLSSGKLSGDNRDRSIEFIINIPRAENMAGSQSMNDTEISEPFREDLEYADASIKVKSAREN